MPIGQGDAVEAMDEVDLVECKVERVQIGRAQ